MIPKRFYDQAVEDYIESTRDNWLHFIKGIGIGLVCGGVLVYLLFT